ncbi:MAG: NADPH-dependent FMN reductase [Polyangiales bacterium]
MTQLLGISGSLRKSSLNTALLRSIGELMPKGATLSIASIEAIPLYNGDLDIEGGPPSVQALKAQIGNADGLLFATPEYNFSIPGVLKNAIDWASRPGFRSVLAHKPVAIIGASPGTVGTARAQGHLKQVLLGTLSEVFPYPEVLVSKAHERIQNGQLADEPTREVLRKMLEAYVSWIRRIG